MNRDKWDDIRNLVERKFDVSDSGSYRLEEEGGMEIDFIEFDGPLGIMRLEYVTKPVILDKKVLFSKRIGSDAKVEYVYGEEKTSKLEAYKWDGNDDEWIKIDLSHFGGMI